MTHQLNNASSNTLLDTSTPDFASKQAQLDDLANCNCCERHQINKPKVFAPWIELPFHGTQNTPCDCPCRHRSRFICRSHPLYVPRQHLSP